MENYQEYFTTCLYAEEFELEQQAGMVISMTKMTIRFLDILAILGSYDLYNTQIKSSHSSECNFRKEEKHLCQFEVEGLCLLLIVLSYVIIIK